MVFEINYMDYGPQGTDNIHAIYNKYRWIARLKIPQSLTVVDSNYCQLMLTVL